MSMDALKHPPVYPTIRDTYQVPRVAFEDYKQVAMICYVSWGFTEKAAFLGDCRIEIDNLI